MDLDTENKRRSAITLAPFTIPPIADGVIGTQDRGQAGYQYSGIPFGAVIPPAAAVVYYMIWHSPNGPVILVT